MASQQRTEELFRQLLAEGLGLDLSDPNLLDTPQRLAKMYHQELFVNVGKNPDDILKAFPNEKKYDEMVLFDNIPFTSICSHHFLPFSGLAWMVYLPNKILVGASKASRLINFYSKRPQLQENLGVEIIDEFERIIEPKGVMLVMRAVHNCMACRGTKSGSNAGMMTSITRGVFRDSLSSRNEALNLITLSMKK